MKRTPIRRTAIKAKPKRPRTWQESGHMGRVANLACSIANADCRGRITCHHPTGTRWKGMGTKATDFEVIPLCEAHHQTGGHGVAYHAGPATWEETYDTQEHFLTVTRIVLAKTSPDWCVFTGEKADPTIDQVKRILDTPTRQG